MLTFSNNFIKFATKNIVIFYCLKMNCPCVKNISLFEGTYKKVCFNVNGFYI